MAELDPATVSICDSIKSRIFCLLQKRTGYVCDEALGMDVNTPPNGGNIGFYFEDAGFVHHFFTSAMAIKPTWLLSYIGPIKVTCTISDKAINIGYAVDKDYVSKNDASKVKDLMTETHVSLLLDLYEIVIRMEKGAP